MGRKPIYGPRASLHMKISPDVLAMLRKHCAKLQISLNKGADDLLRATLAAKAILPPKKSNKGTSHE